MMNPFQQLIRRPVSSTVISVLLCIVCAFSCVGFGVFLSANATVQSIDSSYLTTAYPTTRTERIGVDIGNGRTAYYEASILTPEMWEFISNLSNACSAVQGVFMQSFISAWSPELSTVTSATADGCYLSDLDDPYRTACFVVRLTEIGEFDLSSSTILVPLTAQILDTVLLHDAFTPRSTLHLYCMFSQEELDQLDLQIGNSYIVYGYDYIDNDLAFRTNLATTLKLPLSSIDYQNICYEIDPSLTSAEGEPYVAMYEAGDKGSALHASDIESIDSASLFIRGHDKSFLSDYYPNQVDGTARSISTAEATAIPTIFPINGSAKDFFASDIGAKWLDYLEQSKVRNQSVPVIGTDYLESLLPFQQKECYVSSGRLISQEEYETGAQVCLISEALAHSSGLSVGDDIPLSFYWGIDPLQECEQQGNSNVTAQFYVSDIGFSTGSQTYKIIGLYRQTDLWSQSDYAFTPNTVFIPNAALPTPAYSGNTGIYSALVIQNGKIQEVKNFLEKQGYSDDILLYYDGGFDAIQVTLEHFRENALLLFILSAFAWGIAMLVYIVFFVTPQRKTLGLMRSLGAGKKSAMQHLFLYAMLPLTLSAAIGAGAGAGAIKSVLAHVISSESSSGETFSILSSLTDSTASNQMTVLPWASAIAAGLQILIMTVLLFALIYHFAKKSPRELMQES